MPDAPATLRVDVDGPVARLTLARPERRNALSPAALRELAEAARALDARPEVRVVLVSGEGAAFCAGFDLDAFAAGEGGDPSLARTADLGRRMAEAVAGLRPVTVAAVHGHCVGGGMVLASACDVRVAADDARFALPEAELGIPLAWGGVPRLVREIGPATTMDLVLSCRPVAAAEALALGLVSRVVPRAELAGHAGALAAQLAARTPAVLEITKAQVRAAAEALVPTASGPLDAQLLAAALADPEAAAAVAAYLGRHGRAG
jgi:enoyl-CoA hydratase/carnithine racemase